MSLLVYRPPADVELGDLEDALADAFVATTAALRRGDAVVVVLDERDLHGTGGTARAALAHGLLGLARALAVEGRASGWKVVAVSSTPEVMSDEQRRWIDLLADPGAAAGALVRLGGEHLGRLPT